MGLFNSKSPDNQVSYVQPQQESVDPNAFLEPLMGWMMQQSQLTQQMLQDSQQQTLALSLPQVSDLYPLDYDAENASLQEKINKQITEEDIKRKGVLGTILTNLDDDDEPNANKSSLLAGS